jgi:hypothetical protein
MNKNKPQLKERWVNIRIRESTLKRLRIEKANMDLKVYDEFITLALDNTGRLK